MKQSRLIIVVLLFVMLWAVPVMAKVDITKDRDSYIEVWNTLFGFKVGDPIYEGWVPAGHWTARVQLWLKLAFVGQPLNPQDGRSCPPRPWRCGGNASTVFLRASSAAVLRWTLGQHRPLRPWDGERGATGGT